MESNPLTRTKQFLPSAYSSVCTDECRNHVCVQAPPLSAGGSGSQRQTSRTRQAAAAGSGGREEGREQHQLHLPHGHVSSPCQLQGGHDSGVRGVINSGTSSPARASLLPPSSRAPSAKSVQHDILQKTTSSPLGGNAIAETGSLRNEPREVGRRRSPFVSYCIHKVF